MPGGRGRRRWAGWRGGWWVCSGPRRSDWAVIVWWAAGWTGRRGWAPSDQDRGPAPWEPLAGIPGAGRVALEALVSRVAGTAVEPCAVSGAGRRAGARGRRRRGRLAVGMPRRGPGRDPGAARRAGCGARGSATRRGRSWRCCATCISASPPSVPAAARLAVALAWTTRVTAARRAGVIRARAARVRVRLGRARVPAGARGRGRAGVTTATCPRPTAVYGIASGAATSARAASSRSPLTARTSPGGWSGWSRLCARSCAGAATGGPAVARRHRGP